jgi:hypothetical protein
MPTLRLVLTLTFVVVASAAYAQGTPQQRAACRGDAQRFCKGVKDAGGIYNCLQANSSRISGACRRVISGR